MTLTWLEDRIARARERRGLHIGVIVLRMMIGFAFIPAGLKKVMRQPFTDPTNTGPFHEFLHAFHATGLFYQFVGALQLTAAVLLVTQRYAPLGAALLAPMLAAILVLCWSTGVVPTAIVVTLMSLGLLALILWDIQRWKALLGVTPPAPPVAHPAVNMRRWSRCGWLILVLYFGNTALTGQVYRPRGAEWSNPSFIVLLIIAILPVITFALDVSRADD
jgi:uncharacterized membrane protein YphA (DoxX/SURF4 family)